MSLWKVIFINKIKSTFKIYREYGITTTVCSIVSYVFRKTIVGSILRSIFGESIIEKVSTSPKIGYWPDIENPQSFNEKVLHRKTYTENDIFSTLSDKWAVRQYVKERTTEDILTDVYHVGSDVDQIPFDDLPEEFVIKPTHTSGDVILRDSNLSRSEDRIRNQCKEWLSKVYGVENGEYWYGDIEPKIIIEEYLRDNKGRVPKDYKIFVFHGTVEYIQVDHTRFSNHKRRFYDSDWNPLDFELKYPLAEVIEKPSQLEEMINLAEDLSKGFDFLRIDLYQTDQETIKFGEITLAPGSGAERFNPKKYDFKVGSKW